MKASYIIRLEHSEAGLSGYKCQTCHTTVLNGPVRRIGPWDAVPCRRRPGKRRLNGLRWESINTLSINDNVSDPVNLVFIDQIILRSEPGTHPTDKTLLGTLYMRCFIDSHIESPISSVLELRFQPHNDAWLTLYTSVPAARFPIQPLMLYSAWNRGIFCPFRHIAHRKHRLSRPRQDGIQVSRPPHRSHPHHKIFKPGVFFWSTGPLIDQWVPTWLEVVSIDRVPEMGSSFGIALVWVFNGRSMMQKLLEKIRWKWRLLHDSQSAQWYNFSLVPLYNSTDNVC